MKATKLLLAAALLAGFATFALAGPNPMFTNQQGKAITEKARDPQMCSSCTCSCPAMKK